MITERIDSIDGALLYRMFRLAFASLSFNENYLNEINTFPVSDSDTGTNMKRSFKNGLTAINENQTAGELLYTFAHNMSLNSRGNSGFILSQYFIGLSEYLKDKLVITIQDFCDAIIHAYRVAYAAVVNPEEGTMLTAMREGTKRAMLAFDKVQEKTFKNFFGIFSESVFDSMLNTRSQMKLLETNNVVDSGALGFYLVVDGLNKTFDENSSYFNCEKNVILPKKISDAKTPLTFFRYCTEFIINLKEIRDSNYYLNILKARGDSVVVAINKNHLKVHIHTNDPRYVIDRFKQFGTLVTSKIDDLFETPQFERLKRRKHPNYAVVGFVQGEQNSLLFENLGIDACFPIPHNHIPTEEELKNLLSPYKNENLILYCANKKIEDSIKSIIWWGHYDNFVVVECRGMINAFFKLASSMFNSTFSEFKKHLNFLNKIKTIEFDFEKTDNIHEKLELHLSPKRIKGYSTVVAFGGKNIEMNEINIITSFFANNNDIEFTYFSGGQENPFLIIGVM